MSRSKIYLSLLTAVSIIVISAMFAILMKQRSRIQSDLLIQKELNQGLVLKSGVEEVLWTSLVGNYLMTDSSLLDKNGAVFTSSGHRIAYGELFKNGKLVFKFSPSHCMECVHEVIGHLNQLSEQIGGENIVVIGSYEKSQFLTFIEEEIKEDILIVNDPNGFEHIVLEQQNDPYICLIDAQLSPKYVFYPDKSLGETTDRYLSIMKTLLI